MRVEKRPISELKPWALNPRISSEKDIARLKRQLSRHGQYKPLVVDEEGTVIGGNMRLLALSEMGVDHAWVTVVSAKTDKERMEFALSDNDRVGRYMESQLRELAVSLDPLDLPDYGIDLAGTTTLDSLLAQSDAAEGAKEIDISAADGKCVLKFTFDHERYMSVLEKLEQAKERMGLDTNEELLVALLDGDV